VQGLTFRQASKASLAQALPEAPFGGARRGDSEQAEVFRNAIPAVVQAVLVL